MGFLRGASHDTEPPFLRRARAYWEQSGVDEREAWLRWKAGDHLTSGYLSLQGAINALLAVAHLQGHAQLPTHSPAQLAGICAEADPRFGELTAACEALEAVQERSPFDRERDAAAEQAQARACYDHGVRVRGTVKAYLKENRRRYFSP